MDIIKAEALLRSVDAGSFSAAAEEWGYTPSGVTRMVNALEAELGFTLVTRTQRGISLTADGERVLPIIRELARCNEQLYQLSAEIRGLTVGNLSIGTYFSVAISWLPKIISRFGCDYPGVKINIIEGSNRELAALFAEGRLDGCFTSEQSQLNGDWIPLKADRLLAWLPRDHRWAARETVPLAEFSGEPFIYAMRGEDTDVDNLFKQANITPDVRFTTADSNTAYTMVEAGLGVSIDNELTTARLSGNVLLRPLEPPCYVNIGLAVPSLKKASPAAKIFFNYTRQVVREL